MKRAFLLNGPISRVIASLGHGDSVCIADAGLPIPPTVERIDLALSKGLPSFLDTLAAVTSEMRVEVAVIASELRQSKHALKSRLEGALEVAARDQGAPIQLADYDHETFKGLTSGCRAVIRTGECTPYANIILYAGVTF